MTESTLEQPVTSDRSVEFHLKEFDALRGEITESIAETRLLERYALLATGAIWAWAATNYSKVNLGLVIWIPSFLVLLAALRSFSVFARIERLGLYIAKLERVLRLNTTLGWEHFLRQSRRPVILTTAILFWLFLLLVNVLAAVWFPAIADREGNKEPRQVDTIKK